MKPPITHVSVDSSTDSMQPTTVLRFPSIKLANAATRSFFFAGYAPPLLVSHSVFNSGRLNVPKTKAMTSCSPWAIDVPGFIRFMYAVMVDE